MEKPLHILIIEDNESDAALIIRHLKKADKNIVCEVIETAPQLESALEQQKYDFVICDHSLPQFNDRQALKILQSTEIDIPFIVVSGTVGEETAVELMKAGVHDYIMKDNLARLVPVFHRELSEAEIRRKHKQAEDKISIQASLLDLIGQSVIMVDETDTVTFWNKAAEALYGWSAEEVMGLKLHQFMSHHSTEFHSDDIRKCSITGQSWTREFIEKKRDGSFIPVQITHTPLFDETGNLKGVIGVSFDITERKKTEEAMIRKMDELAASNEELNRINRLTIGREMRMIELKQQCNNLASKLGMKPPYPLEFMQKTEQQKEK